MTSSTRSKPKPKLLVIAGPSGVGKTTIATDLVRRRPDLVLSVSATTRPPRSSERDGIDYRFMTEEEFAALEARGGLLESATVHGHRYGTPRDQIARALAAGTTVVLEIDVQGARQVRNAMPETLMIFIEPPSRETLRARLTGRKTESPQALQDRLRTAETELEAADEFDHRVVNDDLEEALAQVSRILDGFPEPTNGPADGPAKE